MRLQVEAPSVQDPLATLADDYGQAVLHLAWDRNVQTKERTLVFAFVELLPHEIPPPIDDYDRDGRGGYRLTPFSDHHVYVRHAVVTAEQALDWYLACRRSDVAILPENDGRLPLPDEPSAKRMRLARIGEDPPWPQLVTWSPERTELLFCPHWMEHPRVHSLVPLAPFDLNALWPTPRERESAAERLCDLLHFDLRERPELWGSIHLLAPNPVYRRMKTRLLQRPFPSEAELVRFQPRAGKNIEGLELAVQHRRPWGSVDVRRITVQSPLVEVQYPTELHSVRNEVWDPLRGMLEAPAGESAFVRSFQLNIGLVTRTVVAGRSPEDRYEVGRGQFERVQHSTETGPRTTEPSTESAYSRLISAHRESAARTAAERNGQRWFQGEKEEARAYLRTLLHGAHREVWVVDPYFGPDELIGFLPAVGDVGIPIHVLTSARRLRAKEKHELMEARESGIQTVEVEASDVFAEHLPQLRTDLRNPLHVRVMEGKEPVVHDRFLMLDERVLSFGSSLNALGKRGTILLHVPDPGPVREALREAWNDAKDFESWYHDRKMRRSREDGCETREAAE
jgi:hypothetical protein